MAQQPPQPEPPGRSRNASLKKHDTLFALLTALAEAHPDDPERVADASYKRIGCAFETLRDSLVWALRAENKVKALRKIAGNCDALVAGRPVLDTLASDTPGWGVIHIVSVDSVYRTDFKTRRRTRNLEVRAKAMTGPPCPEQIVQVMKPAFLRYVSRFMGFTRQSGKRPLVDDRELSGLRLFTLFVPGEGRVRMNGFRLPDALRKWNVDLLNARQRLEQGVFQCPLSLPLDLPCWKCAAGRDRCPIACRPRTLEERSCACGVKFWFNPARPADLVCQACEIAKIKEGR